MLEVIDKNPQSLGQFTSNVLYRHFLTMIDELRKESLNDLKRVSPIETTNHLRGKIEALENLMEILLSLSVNK